VWTGRVVSPVRDYSLKYWLGHKRRDAYHGTDVLPVLDMLDKLATKHGQKERVLEWLRDLWDESHPLQQPGISHLMCRLGDTSKLSVVQEGFFQGRYYSGVTLEPSGLCLGADAVEESLRQLILYGTRDDHEKLRRQLVLTDDPLHKGGAICAIFGELAERKPELPEDYWTDEFPFYFLIWVLDFRNVTEQHYGYDVRGCDQSAQAIQRIARRDFGHRYELSVDERDGAIEAARLWWAQTGQAQYRAK